MDFRVYMIVEIPLIGEKYELLVPIDRRIHDLIDILIKATPSLTKNYYKERSPVLYCKATGRPYNINTIIKDSDIKNGTRVVLL